jgi:hypothetical protein
MIARRCFSLSGLEESVYASLSAKTYVRVMVGRVRKMAGYAVWMFSPAVMMWTWGSDGMEKSLGEVV